MTLGWSGYALNQAKQLADRGQRWDAGLMATLAMLPAAHSALKFKALSDIASGRRPMPLDMANHYEQALGLPEGALRNDPSMAASLAQSLAGQFWGPKAYELIRTGITQAPGAAKGIAWRMSGRSLGQAWRTAGAAVHPDNFQHPWLKAQAGELYRKGQEILSGPGEPWAKYARLTELLHAGEDLKAQQAMIGRRALPPAPSEGAAASQALKASEVPERGGPDPEPPYAPTTEAPPRVRSGIASVPRQQTALPAPRGGSGAVGRGAAAPGGPAVPGGGGPGPGGLAPTGDARPHRFNLHGEVPTTYANSEYGARLEAVLQERQQSGATREGAIQHATRLLVGPDLVRALNEVSAQFGRPFHA